MPNLPRRPMGHIAGLDSDSHISAGELEDVRRVLPEPLAELLTSR